ncbi:MAG: hypothetical protein QOG87_3175 [Actinomycetota bacterium]|jgi:SAM-dependent methyltransferase
MDDYLLAQHSEMEWSHWWFSGRRIILADILRRWLGARQDLRLLDIGCGAGTMIEVLAAYGQVAGMDTSEEAVRYCRTRLPDVTFSAGRVPEALPAPESLDVITAFDVIEHIPDEAPALAGIRDTLVPGGLFVCTVPAYQWMWSAHDELNHHCRRYTRRQLVGRLEAAGFEVEWSSYFNAILFPPAAAVRLVRKLLRMEGSGGSDFDVGVSKANGLLRRLFASERIVLRRARLPFGLSIAAVARRPADSQATGARPAASRANASG